MVPHTGFETEDNASTVRLRTGAMGVGDGDAAATRKWVAFACWPISCRTPASNLCPTLLECTEAPSSSLLLAAGAACAPSTSCESFLRVALGTHGPRVEA